MKIRFLLASIFFMSMQTIVHADSNPMMSRVYGNQFTPEIAQTRSAGQVGVLDTTFNGTSSYVTPAHGNYAYAVQALSDGTFITLTSNSSTSSWLTKYNAQGVVVSSGFGTSGVLALSGYSIVEFMTLDPQNRLLISGNNDNTGSNYPWIQRINPNGTVDGTFSFTDGAAWTSSGQINQLAQQTTGKIIAVGFNGSYGMIARYNLDGSHDATFGYSGYVILNGGNGFQTITTSLYSVVVDSANNIYIAYVDSNPTVNLIRLTPGGIYDTSWNGGSQFPVTYLNSSFGGGVIVASQMRMIIDSHGDLILAVTSEQNDTPLQYIIKATSVATSPSTTTPTTPGTFANVTMNSGVFGSGSSSYDFRNMMATSNGSVYFIGSCLTTKQMMVARYTTAGVLDTAFNGNGVNFFNTTASPSTNALLYSGSITPTGEIYGAGSQLNAGTTTPYVSRLYNTPYVTQTAQFPAPQEQGIFDQTFGATGTETYSGVTTIYNGLYASIMMQQSAAAVEVTAGSLAPHGDIVVGLNGLSNNIATSSMMFAWLTQEGAIDTSVNSTGYLTLQNLSGQNEYITGMLEDGSGNIYVSGYTSTSTTPTSPGNSANTSAILRAYSSSTSGTATWNASQPTVGSTYSQGVGLSLQNNRTLLCVDDGSGVGHITSYISGTLDTTFGAGGSGTISSTSFGLNMGPCYGLAINIEDYIYAAYVDSSNSHVNLVAFEANGSALVPTFGSSGIVANLFSGQTVAANNVRIGFVETGDIVVAAVTATHILVAYINPDSGAVDFSTNTAITGTSSLQLTKVTGVSDGTALVTLWDNVANSMYLARVNASAVLDTTFNSQGSQKGVLPVQIGTNYTSRIASSALVQSTAGVNQGNIVVIGYQSVTAEDASPMAMRVYGDPSTTEILNYPLAINTAGTFEIAYFLPSLSMAGAGNVIFTYPSTSSHAGKLLVGIDAAGSYSIVYRVYELTMALDLTFGSGTGGYTIAGLAGISTISLDANHNILVGGTGWAQLINENGSSAATPFNFTTTATNIATVSSIYQQQSGRYIVAGTEAVSNKGLLVAFQDVASFGAFQVDASFNPLLVGSVPYAGCYYVGTTGLSAMAINTTYNASPLCDIDTIVVAYKNGGNVLLSEVTADGSGLVFGPITTGVTADSSATIRLNIDGSQNIVVGGSVAASHQVKVQRYDSAGGTSTAFTGTGVVSGVQTITNLGSAGVTLTGLMATTTQQTVLTGYNNAGGNGLLFAARLASNGQLDSGWNATPTAPDTAGVLTYSSGLFLDPYSVYVQAVDVYSSSIAIDGTILSIGGTNALAFESFPIVMKVAGDTLVTQVAQDPLEIASGIIDTTIPNGSSGSWNLSGRVSGIPAKIYMYSATVNSSPNGAMLIASTDSTHVYLTQLNQDLSINTHFATGTSNVVTFTVSGVTITDLFVADNNDIVLNVSTQPIYLVGYTSGNVPWAAQVAYDGSSSTVFSPASALTTTGSIRQSINSRLLISGYNGTSGAIVAYNSAMTAIDTSFGNNSGTGYYTTGINTPIVAMAIDNSDFIYIAYQTSSSQVVIQRLLDNGTALDPSFNSGGTVNISGTNLSATQIKMAIDLTNNQLVVAVQAGTGTGNVIQLQRYTLSGAAAGAISTITISGATLNLTDLFIDSVQNIYVIGYNSVSNKAIVARAASINSTTIALDATYAAAVGSVPAGIASVTAGSMTVTNAGALDLDRRVYLVGSGSGNGYMARVFGNIYATEISQANSSAMVGTLDTTLVPNNNGGIDLNTQFGSSMLVGYTAYDVTVNPNGDGTTLFAFGDGTNLIIGKVNAYMIPVTTFGGNSTGLTTAMAMSTINSMTIDGKGNIIVAGAQGGAQQIYLYNSSGTFQATFENTFKSSVATTVVQQKSGRYIVGGYCTITATAIIQAFKSAQDIISPGLAGTLALDKSFGPNGSNGIYNTGAYGVPIDDLCVDSNDDIYFVYRDYYSDGYGNQVYLSKITANGSGLVDAQNSPTAFNSGAIITTSIGNAISTARIAINQAGNILIGAEVYYGYVYVELYNGSTGAVITSPYWVYPLTGPITKLVGSITPNNEFYGIVSGGTATVFALTSAGVLDANFNPLTTPGYLTTNVESINNVYGLGVQLDGKIVMVGSSATPDPIYVRVYGYPYVAENLQGPNIVGAGELDTTLWPSTGLFALNNTTNSTFNTAITGYAVKRIYESGIGLMTFVADSGNNTTIFQLNKDLTVNTGFNTNGYRTLASNYGATTGLFVDPVGTNFIVGNKSGVAWAQGISSNGSSIFAPTSGFMGSVQAVNQQSSESFNRIIFAGLGTTTGSKQPNTNGYLVGFTPAGSADGTFGSGGNVDMGSAYPITDIAVDYYDNIITVANNTNNSGTVILQKVTKDGGTVTDISSFGTPITGAVGNVKMALDGWGNIVVAAATATGYIVRTYINNNLSTGSTTGSDNASTAQVIIVGTTPVLSNIYTTFDGKITLVGYDASNGNAIIARLISTWDEVTDDGTLALDTETFNTSLTGITPQLGVLVTALSLGGTASDNQVFDGIIHYDNRIMLAVANSGIPQPYMARLFGDAYATYVSAVMAGLPGTYDVFFGSTTPKLGYYDLTKLALRRLSSVLLGYEGKAILEVPGGGYYLALTDNATNSLLVKVLVDGSLDTSYNSGGAGGYPAGIAQSTAPIGVNSILMDGAGKILLTGTHSGAGWVQRYTATSSGATSGLIDSTANSGALAFNSTGQVAPGTTASVTVEQTLGRYVVAGFNGSNGTLFGYESLAPDGTPGSVDITFNSTGTPGSLVTGYTNTIQNLVADQYDRLIFAVLNNAGTAVDLIRLTPTGEYDWTFGSGGVVANALTSISSSSQIRVAIDAHNNIIVAATSSTTNTFSVHAYDNGTNTGSVDGLNGFAAYVQLDVALLTNAPTITGLITSADGYAAVLGNQTGTQTINGLPESASMWVARITSDGLLDSFNFNPAGLVTLDGITYSGGVPGIYQATFSAASANVYNALTVNAAGALGVLGYEIISSVITPYLIQVNYNAVTTQVAQSPDAHAVGTNDPTLGAGSGFYDVNISVPGPSGYVMYYGLYGTQVVSNGENFYGTTYSDSTNTQYAKAVALMNQNNIVVAIDGTSNYPLGNSNYPINNSNSQIYIDMLDNEGIFNLGFGANGQATASGLYQYQSALVSAYYQNQYAQDMIIFTVGGVNKAIIAGYIHDTTMGIYGSLLLQFNLSTSAIDQTFGGFNNNPLGLAVGDGKQAFAVGQQSLGRIIVGGLSQGGNGLLLGYTPSGKLDSSFGNDGYQEHQTGATGIYTHTIDSQNRIVFAYNNGGTLNIARMLADGSGLDTSFGDGSGVISGDISIPGLQSSVNNNFKVILDGSANIIATAVTGDGTTSNAITIANYQPDGGDTNYSPTTYTAGTGFPGTTSSTFVMSKLLADIDSKYSIVMCDSHANNVVLTRLQTNLSLDTTFNGTGYLTYVVGGGTQTTNDALIHPDGRIIVVGSNT